MKHRLPQILWFAAFLALLSLKAGPTQAAARASSERIHVVYQEQPSGEWQVFLFGLHSCGSQKNVQVIWPTDANTQPVEIECDLQPKGK